MTDTAAATAPRTARRPRLGEILRDRGAVEADALRAALRRQREVAAPLGEILRAGGLARGEDVAAALALQRGVRFVDLDAQPPDPALLREAQLLRHLQTRSVPWGRVGGRIILASVSPETLAGAEPLLRRGLGLPRDAEIELAACAPEAFDRLLAARFPEALARRAAARTPARLSARGADAPLRRLGFGGALAGAALAAILAPGVAMPLLFAIAMLLTAVNILLRLALMAVPARREWLPCPRPGGPDPDAPPPRISLLIALYREPRIAAQLIDGLRALDYPRERLEALLALEADDAETAAALRACDPPPWIRIVVVPPGGPRTKPRALNHALDFATGEIVGVYDAEDRPAPGQLRTVAGAFAGASPKLACVQARLAFRNEADGWIPRCFAVEYLTWFNLMLPGMARMGFPLPLGGTSMFVRRAVLERLGAWDAHNVTEDADLGIRLARAGYLTGIVDSETAEEATRTPLAWIRQRSRWQKGYLMTWMTHMRAPCRLLRDLGARGFLGFQAQFVGAASAALAQPLFWAVWIWPALAGPVLDPDHVPAALHLGLAWMLLVGQGVVVASSLLALRRSGRTGLRRAALSLPLYWPLGAVSALKSLAETAAAPLYWDKTEHGLAPRRSRFRGPLRWLSRSARPAE